MARTSDPAHLARLAAASGALRDDVASDELAGCCLHALAVAGSLPTKAAVHRLVTVTLDGLRHSS
ncbi:SbtR family transcriptional regulator [Streptomyces asiaticus]